MVATTNASDERASRSSTSRFNVQRPASINNLLGFYVQEAHKAQNGNKRGVSFRRWREFIRMAEVAQKSSADADPPHPFR